MKHQVNYEINSCYYDEGYKYDMLSHNYEIESWNCDSQLWDKYSNYDKSTNLWQ